jgi:hypothetical protein
LFLWRGLKDGIALLAAVSELLELDGVGPVPAAEGLCFEKQIGALFRILSAAHDNLLERSFHFTGRTMLLPRSVLALVSRPHLPPLASFVGRAFSRRLDHNSYLLRERQFVFGDDLATWDCGRYMPKLTNHEGFDILLVDQCEGSREVFLTAIKCTFSQEKGETGRPASSVKLEDLAKKFVDSLSGYPCLVDALWKKRFCFIAAAFQALAADASVDAFADAVMRQLSTLGWAKAIERDHVRAAVLLLRRSHIKSLLTPTLENRYHWPWTRVLTALPWPRGTVIRRPQV